MSNPHDPLRGELADRAVERLFARFSAMYGDAAMHRMWGQQDPAAVQRIWAAAVARIGLQRIAAGLRHLEDTGSTFPPALGEFVGACKAATVPPEHRPLAIPHSRTQEEIAAGRELAERIATQVRATPVARDPSAWARRILQRHADGDTTLSHAAIATAKAALEALRVAAQEGAA